MTQFSNITAAKKDFLIQRGSSKGWVFTLPYADGSLVNWNDYPGAKMDWRAGNKIVLSHEIGGSFIIDVDPTRLLWYPWGIDLSMDVGPFEYKYDFKLPVSTIGALYLFRGIAKVVDNITK